MDKRKYKEDIVVKIIFIRHAEPDYSIDSLTEKGWREAEILSERVKNWKVDRFFVSPMGRAKDTASLSLKKCEREAEELPWLQEFYYRVKSPFNGEDIIAWDFMPSYFSKQEELHDKNKWYETEIMKSGNMGEHYREVCEGFDAILKEYGYEREEGGMYRVKESSDATLVFFCHLGVSFVIMSHLLGIAPPVLWQGFFVAPTAVTVLGCEERTKGEAAFRVQIMGDTRHLSEAGEPISASGYFTDTFQL